METASTGGLVGYDAAFTQLRSRVRFPLGVYFVPSTMIKINHYGILPNSMVALSIDTALYYNILYHATSDIPFSKSIVIVCLLIYVFRCILFFHLYSNNDYNMIFDKISAIISFHHYIITSLHHHIILLYHPCKKTQYIIE